MQISDEARQLADQAWALLVGYATDGLPACYTSAKDMLFDWFPDLLWTETEESAQYLLESKPQADFDLIKEKLGLDMRAVLIDETE